MSRRLLLSLSCTLVLALAAPAAAPATAASHAPDRPPVAARPVLEPLHDADAFRNPPRAVRPKIRWWWSGDYNPKKLVSELEAINDAGFSGVEIAFDPAGWASQEQRDAMGAVLRAAKRLEMTVDLTLGHTWPVRAPSVTPENGLASQELAYGSRDVAGPGVYVGPVPPPKGNGGGEIHAVVAGRTLQPGTPAPAAQAGPGLTPNGPSVAPVASQVIDPDSLVVLTDEVGEDGTLTWDVPEGHWTVFGIWHRYSAEGREEVPVLDHFNAQASEAVGEYIAEHMVGKENLGVLREVGGSFFEDSLEIDAEELFWTHEFTEEFRERRGYDPTPYLPFLFVAGAHHYPVWEEMPNAYFDLPDGAGERVRSDYFKTLTDLYAEEHMLGFQKWAETHNMKFRTQAAFGAALDVTRSARELALAGGLPDEESLNAGDPGAPSDSNWRFATDHYRSVVGGVQQGGGTEIGSELGAMFWRAWQAGLGDYKAIMDKQWAFGVTRPIPHGYANNPEGSAWPGRDRFFGIVADSWNAEHWPQWKMWKPLTDYWARGTMVLQHGKPQIDVAVYRDGFVTSAATFAALGTDVANHQALPALPGYDQVNPEGNDVVDGPGFKPAPFFDGEALERAGYTYQYIDPVGLTEPGAVGRRTLYPQGPQYRALIVDERAIPADTAESILQAARRGVRVVLVGEPPQRGMSLADAKSEDARVQRAIRRLVQTEGVAQVDTQADALAALRELRVSPAARWSAPAPLYSNHRRGNGVDYWYLWNGGDEPLDITGSFATSGVPHEMDLMTGETTRLAEYRTGRRRLAVPVRLGPGETTVIAFDHDARPDTHVVATGAVEVVSVSAGIDVLGRLPGTHIVQLSDGTSRTVRLGPVPEPMTPESWDLHVAEVGPAGASEHELQLTDLADWRDIPELRRASGTGTYTTTLDVPVSWLRKRRGVQLDLGVVEGAMQVFLNGRRVAPDVSSDRPYADQPVRAAGRRFDVTDLLRPGANELRVVVTTTLKNKIVGLWQSGQIGPPLGPVQPATQPYGLLGPVSLVPYGRATISTR